jgi:hypothetical protein
LQSCTEAGNSFLSINDVAALAMDMRIGCDQHFTAPVSNLL